MEKQFVDLYCLDKKHNIRVFKIRIEKDKANENFVDDLLGDSTVDITGATIISETGLLNGKLTAKSKKISKGKNIGKANETTPYEQAKLEAQSMWINKLDEGYKSDQMCISKYGSAFLSQVISGNILHNTNANWDEKPMLAEPIGKVKKIDYPVYVQPKLNGVRCLAKLKEGKVTLMSRGGKYYNIPHIKKALKPFFDEREDLILDGEIFNKDYDLQTISGAVREEKGDKDKSFLQYHIYDVADIKYTQQTRLYILDTYNKELWSNSNIIHLVETNTATDSDHIKLHHDNYVTNGYEGAIVRNKFGKYHFGFRHKDLIKVKEFIDEEFVLVGCKVSEGQSIGDSFVFELKNDKTEAAFYARPRGTRAQKEEWYNNRNWTGKKATVRYQERTKDSLPHQAHVVVIRDYE